MAECNCPNPAAMQAIPDLDCQVNLNQIQKIGFQRGGYLFDSAVPANDFNLLSVWQGLKAAVDGTKLVITPYIGADPIIEAGDAITTGGGDNSTLNGKEEVEGANPSTFSCTFKGLSAEIETAIKANFCETDLVVYLFLKGGKIALINVSATTKEGTPIESPFLTDRNNAGFGTKDTHAMRFSLPSGWSENIEIFNPGPTWNPLTDL